MISNTEGILIQAKDWHGTDYASSDDGFITFTYQVHSGLEINEMGKKEFKRLIKRASQPVPKEQDKQRHSGGYSENKTRSRKTANTSD